MSVVKGGTGQMPEHQTVSRTAGTIVGLCVLAFFYVLTVWEPRWLN